MLGRLGHNVGRDAADEGVSSRPAWWGFWAPFVGGAVLLAVFLLSRDVYYSLLREDHLVEWVQFSLLLYTAPVAVLGALASARRGHWLTVAFLAVVALGVLFLAGEEISWGQRVLGFADEAAGNRQGEFNVHNIEGQGGVPVERIFRIAEAMIGLVGAVLPFLVRWRPARLTSPAWRVITPPIFLSTSFLVILAFRVQRILMPADLSVVIRSQEWAEICLYGALAWWVSLTWLRESGRWSPLEGGGSLRRPGALKPLLAVAALILVVVAGFAVRTMASGIEPGNL